jgi:predicted transcriptional regulator
MSRDTDTIEVDKTTADTLNARAAERGVSVAELLAEMVREGEAVEVGPAEIAELDRRWANIKAGEATIPHEDVVRWLNTWGTPAFKPWRD